MFCIFGLHNQILMTAPNAQMNDAVVTLLQRIQNSQWVAQKRKRIA
jgi:hypothetical protein